MEESSELLPAGAAAHVAIEVASSDSETESEAEMEELMLAQATPLPSPRSGQPSSGPDPKKRRVLETPDPENQRRTAKEEQFDTMKPSKIKAEQAKVEIEWNDNPNFKSLNAGKRGFRQQHKSVLIGTVARCGLTVGAMLHLLVIGRKALRDAWRRNEQIYALVTEEQHKDGSPHLHFMIINRTKPFGEITGNTLHGDWPYVINWGTCFNESGWATYCKKDQSSDTTLEMTIEEAKAFGYGLMDPLTRQLALLNSEYTALVINPQLAPGNGNPAANLGTAQQQLLEQMPYLKAETLGECLAKFVTQHSNNDMAIRLVGGVEKLWNSQHAVADICRELDTARANLANHPFGFVANESLRLFELFDRYVGGVLPRGLDETGETIRSSLIVLSGPTGCGKTKLVMRLLCAAGVSKCRYFRGAVRQSDLPGPASTAGYCLVLDDPTGAAGDKHASPGSLGKPPLDGWVQSPSSSFTCAAKWQIEGTQKKVPNCTIILTNNREAELMAAWAHPNAPEGYWVTSKGTWSKNVSFVNLYKLGEDAELWNPDKCMPSWMSAGERRYEKWRVYEKISRWFDKWGTYDRFPHWKCHWVQPPSEEDPEPWRAAAETEWAELDHSDDETHVSATPPGNQLAAGLHFSPLGQDPDDVVVVSDSE